VEIGYGADDGGKMEETQEEGGDDDDNDDDGEDDDAERKSEQAVSRLAPATCTVADSFSLGGPSLSSGIRAAKDYPFSTTGPSSKVLT